MTNRVNPTRPTCFRLVYNKCDAGCKDCRWYKLCKDKFKDKHKDK